VAGGATRLFGPASHFTAPMSDAVRAAFLADHPHRVAFKHAHSRQNADSTWGRDVLRSIQFAFHALNQRHGGSLTRAGREWRGGGRALVDYFTETILYQPCAAMATPAAWRTGEIGFGANRCTSLKEKGLLKADTLAAQAEESRQRLHAMGFEPDSDDQTAFHFLVAPGATANKYANAQGRFGIEDKPASLASSMRTTFPWPTTKSRRWT
jgi:hydroxybutyrate-dimer hydrolase